MKPEHANDAAKPPARSAAGGRAAGKRRTLWGVFAAVAVPLVVLLGCQYWWLADLERTSTIARLATLESFLSGVDQEVRFGYTQQAERVLSVPAARYTPDCVQDIARFFRHRAAPVARTLFAVTLVGDFPGSVFLYDPQRHQMTLAPEDSAETRAIYLATAAWAAPAMALAREPSGLYVDERDPEHRIVLNPILDESSKLVGLAGMVVDQEHFRAVVLPAAIERVLPERPRGGDRMILTVVDEQRRLVCTGRQLSEADNEVEAGFTFLFKDWRIGLRGDYATPEQWARANFLLNITLSSALALVLLGGVWLALRTAARELRLSQMKSDFVSNVSHELRTPLASIRVFGELMRLGRVDRPEKVRSFGEYIENESRRLTQLINNILDFSKIESGGKLYRFSLGDLEEVVTEALDSFSVRLRHQGRTVAFERPATPVPPVRLDPDALVQALANLLDNAVKYAGETARITVRLALRDGEVVLAVADDGVGIAADEQGKIFDRFHRVGTGLVHDVKGCGLGLAIVQHVVEAHGGRVTLDSEPGRGSTFAIHLPVPAGARPASAEPAPSSAPRLAPGLALDPEPRT